MSAIAKLRKNTTLAEAAVLTDSKYFSQEVLCKTDIPMLNVALGGSVDSGITSGVLTIAGPSKHFKSKFAIELASTYMNTFEDAGMLFYDSEFGTPKSYIDEFNNTDSILHSPIVNFEELKFDIIGQLDNLTKEDNVFVLIDSLGNLASIKELEDAKNQKGVADMTRAKANKSLFRMITPYLKIKNIPLIAIQHTYQEMSLYPKQVVSGGTGGYYSSDNIWIIGRQQEKLKTEKVGYNFIINIDKSRFVREGLKIPITVTWDGGINRWSGLYEIGILLGYIEKNGKKFSVGDIDGLYYKDELRYNGDVWEEMLKNQDFCDKIRGYYQIGQSGSMKNDLDLEEVLDDFDD